MATTQGFFQIVDWDTVQPYGGLTAKTASELCNGKLAINNYDGTASIATASTKPAGFIVDNRTLLYRPTDIYAAADEPVTLVSGHVRAWAGVDFFVGGTLPSAGAALYAAATGLMDTSGTHHIGFAIDTSDIRAIPNTTADVVLIDTHFGGREL